MIMFREIHELFQLACRSGLGKKSQMTIFKPMLAIEMKVVRVKKVR